ncbi:hypothetical protein [Paraburkholderia sp. JHI869]|uniref:hypothetical protein n=1 Tax=Paraburkholderia sp. JHI869 TaxID=3112959 RepID=UPI003171694D
MRTITKPHHWNGNHTSQRRRCAATSGELARYLADPIWRLCSGKLYKIIVKGDDAEDDGLALPFKPSRAQRRLIKRLWYRNLILKARQLAFQGILMRSSKWSWMIADLDRAGQERVLEPECPRKVQRNGRQVARVGVAKRRG